MKSLQLLFLVLLSNPFVQGQELNVHHYTVAKSGLNVRVMPKLGMPKVTTLLYLTEVEIIAETGVELSIQDEGKTLSGQWIEIQFKDENNRIKSGFVFDQFVKSISFGTSAPKGTLQIAHLSKAHFDFLTQHLSLETLIDYDEYQRLIRQEDEDLIDLYVKARSLKKQLDKEFRKDYRLNVEKLLRELRDFEKKEILGIYSSCIAECTMYSMELRTSDFLNQSNEDRERIFFSILKELAPSGDLKGSYHPVWTTAVCDYAGYSKLGNRMIYNNMKKMKAYLSEYSESQEDLSYKILKTLRNTIIRQLSMRAYGSTQEQVIAELDDMLSDEVLFEGEFYHVKEAKARVKVGIVYNRNIEFACATTRCTVCF